MPVERKRDDRPATFNATIIAKPEVFRALQKIDVDFLPVERRLENGVRATEALLREDQIADVVAAGATVELRSLIDPEFPSEFIMSTEQAMKRLDELRKYREKEE